MFFVHIVISDRNWILERLASEISRRLDYVSYDTEPDPSADVQYYMTYSTRRKRSRVSPLEVAFFTHYEEFHEEAQQWYWEVADQVDHRVCMSQPYVDLFHERGYGDVSLISPGVDHDRFTPRLRIGVVGRTYPKGRKGEDLVRQVMDIPDIDWHFTGRGWPGQARFVPENSLPDFYRSMDYILVPSHYEGGPMCVLEALACGKQIIGPPVGWIPEYPHIEFEKGNAEDLRRVLLQLLEERKTLAASVASVSWDEWSRRHDELFRRLVAEKLPHLVSEKREASVRTAALWVSALEKEAKGGPTVRVKNTLRALRQLGVRVHQMQGTVHVERGIDVLHAFNVSPPEETISVLFAAKRAGVPAVVSPIILDYSERVIYSEEIPRLFAAGYSSKDMDRMLAGLRDRRATEIAAGQGLKEPGVGFFSKLINILNNADHVICLSQREQDMLRAIGANPRAVSIVHNATNTAKFGDADPALFEQAYNVRDFVLCVGRKEARKNQLMLLYALRKQNIPIVLIGHEHTQDKLYLEQLHRLAGPNAHLIDRLEPGGPMLASAYAASRVFVLPSWSEGAPLVALEAAAAGCNLVLSNRSSEQEYFADFARFCDPADPASIRDAVMAAYATPLAPEQRERQKAYMRDRYSWDRYARETLQVYEQTVQAFRSGPAAAAHAQTQNRIYIDLTTSGERSGTPTGVPRVERMYAIELKKLLPERVQLVKWHKPARAFLPVSLEQADDGSYTAGAATYPFDPKSGGRIPYAYVEFAPNALLLVMGGTWNADSLYLQDLIFTKRVRRLKLITCIYDVIPAQFPHYTPKTYHENFRKHVKTVISLSDKLLAISECTGRAVEDFVAQNRLMMPGLDVIRLGDEIAEVEEVDLEKIAELRQLMDGRPFVLTVSTITPRKNFDMLYQVWLRLLANIGEETPKLILVGREGYNATSLMTTLRDDINIHGHIHVLHDISDDALRWLYGNCLFTVYPTLYEGWGLPVAESLAHGKICIASDVSSVPEIAPGLADLVDPLDFKGWYETIVTYIRDAEYRARREQEIAESYRQTTWETAAKELIQILNTPFLTSTMLPEYRPGSRLSFRRALAPGEIPGTVYQTGGWGTTEDSGTWTVGNVAALAFSRIATTAEYVVLCVEAEPFCPKNRSVIGDIEVVVNNVVVAVWIVSQGGFYRAVIPAALVSGDQPDFYSIVEFRIPNPVRPKDFGIGEDTRRIGLRFQVIELLPAPQFPIEQELSLRRVANSDALNAAGWAATGQAGMIATGHSSVLLLRPQAARQEQQLLSLRIAPFHMVGVDPVEVTVHVQGRRVAMIYLTVGLPQTIHAVLPVEELAAGGELLVEFSVANALKIGANNIKYDGKARSFILEAIELAPLAQAMEAQLGSELAGGHALRLGIEGNAEPHLLNGWCMPQLGGTWTEGEDAYVALHLAEKPQGPLQLRLQCVPFINALTPTLHVQAFVNEQPLEKWTLAKEGETELTATVPPEAVDGHRVVLVRLHTRDPKSTRELGLGTDQRRLGLLVRELGLNPA